MSKPETVCPKVRGAAVHARSSSVPSELQNPLLNRVRFSRPQPVSSKSYASKSTESETNQSITGERYFPIAIYSPQLGHRFILSTLGAMQTPRGLTPPANVASSAPVSKRLFVTKHASCTNSPLANHKTFSSESKQTATNEQ
ncbi:hypothetical protein FBUS_05833 [Fasciolopsis buskii]|uniref:Uncharacterized protein n=1 Tax=Fasciolopsis buskii TaxID=27845 RepID=A0A8E0S017_9TREM|nr:hypothetical protein FBUS_05833 [Fasciolopsis buski]